MEKLHVEVEELHWDRIPRITRWRINRWRKRHETGLLMFTISRAPVRHSASRYWRQNEVSENGRILTQSDTQWPFSRFRRLSPGRHRLDFVTADMKAREAKFSREVDLGQGQILVVGCRPSYSYRPFNKNPPPERWYLGVFGPR